MKMKKRMGIRVLAGMLACMMLFASCGSAGSKDAAKTTAAGETKAEGETNAAEETKAEGETNAAEETKAEGEMNAAEETKAEEETNAAGAARERQIPEIAGLKAERKMELSYAQCFDVFYYEGGYTLIRVYDSADYLLVPEGKEAPEGLDPSTVVIAKPAQRIYLAATSAMSLFDAMGALDHIRLSGTRAEGWYVENAARAMEDGRILFAGKYNEPDYELLVDEKCDLAIESTMILHSPKVQEMIEMLNIPVFMDRSSYEDHPLGRTEWIKLYGALVGMEDQASAFFDEQAKIMDELTGFEKTDKTVAYFYISTDGLAVVRKPEDYIPKMIELAGAKYAFTDTLNESEATMTTVSMSMEQFYSVAVNADYLVYNASIDTPISGISDLLAKSELFADFKAVKEGNVWSTGRDLYQSTDTVGNLIGDFHLMITGGDENQMKFLHKVQ